MGCYSWESMLAAVPEGLKVLLNEDVDLYSDRVDFWIRWFSMDQFGRGVRVMLFKY